jgi:hypothetical protein
VIGTYNTYDVIVTKSIVILGNGMPEKETAPAVPVSIRFDPVVKKALEKAAKDDARSVSSYVQKLVMERLKEGKYLK